MNKWKEVQNVWAPSQEKQNDKCFPRGDTHKLQDTQGCSSPMCLRLFNTYRTSWALGCPFLQFVREWIPCSVHLQQQTKPHITTQDEVEHWQQTTWKLTRLCDKNDTVIMNVGVKIIKHHCHTLQCEYSKKTSSRMLSEKHLNQTFLFQWLQ